MFQFNINWGNYVEYQIEVKVEVLFLVVSNFKVHVCLGQGCSVPHPNVVLYEWSSWISSLLTNFKSEVKVEVVFFLFLRPISITRPSQLIGTCCVFCDKGKRVTGLWPS